MEFKAIKVISYFSWGSM